MAKGNCNSINKDIAGKIISGVRGFDEVTAAVAKELKATNSGIPLQRAILHAYTSIRTHHQRKFE